MSTSRVVWEEAGRGWGARAAEWAYLWEPYALPANEVLFDRLGVDAGVRLLDIACGSGFAPSVAARRGALVSGIDASEQLVTIAAARTPSGSFLAGDMFALPFTDDSFDVATSFNGIWKGCEGALEEAKRVLVRGGRIGLTFWGRFERLGLMPYFLKVIELSPASHGTASMEQGDTKNVIEDMLRATGAGDRQRSQRVARRADCRSSARGGWAICARDRGRRLRRVLYDPRRSHFSSLCRWAGCADHVVGNRSS